MNKYLSKLEQYKMAGCPPATRDVSINLQNRQKAIDVAMYGPMDIENPGSYWKDIASEWGVDEQTAKGKVCNNCAAFNVTSAMLSCIEQGINDADALDVIELADLGYCEIFHFKCNGNRSCSAHLDGGPIKD